MKYLRFIYVLIILIMLMVIIVLSNKPAQIEVVTQYEPVFVDVVQEPTYAYNVTSEEREMLARLVYLEANVESLECQKAIASVVINRWESGRWGDTLEKVVYFPNQFSPSGIIYKTTPTETNYEAVDYVLKNGSILPKYVLYFRASYGFSNTWSGYIEYRQIDNTFFGFFEKDVK